jgi:hypothetical protein
MANIVDDNMYNQLKQLYNGNASKASKAKAKIESSYTTEQYNSLVNSLNTKYGSSSNTVYTPETTNKVTNTNVPTNTYGDTGGAANATKYTGV